MLDWRIYYGDGTAYSSADGPWAAAPCRNVQYLVTLDDLDPGDPNAVGSLAWSGDYYLWFPGHALPEATDWSGLLDYLAETEGDTGLRGADLSIDWLQGRGVKLARTLATGRWQLIRDRVMNDPDFPKSAFRSPSRRGPR